MHILRCESMGHVAVSVHVCSPKFIFFLLVVYSSERKYGCIVMVEFMSNLLLFLILYVWGEGTSMSCGSTHLANKDREVESPEWSV